MRGPKPKPRRADPDAALPRCPPHLSDDARKEWRRLASSLHQVGLLTTADRAALAAYCQAWARWVEAEEKLKETPALIKTPSGYIQQSPWLSIANKQLEIMGRFMGELGLTPVARTRLPEAQSKRGPEPLTVMRIVYRADDGVSRDLKGNVIDTEVEDAIEVDGDATRL